MTNAITRAQVWEAINKSECFVPDFTTRKKTALTWSKVYISIQNGKLRFVELNFLQRLIRYLVGCVCYADTVVKEKDALEKVKAYVHIIMTAPDYDSIARDLFTKVQTTSDYSCLSNILKNSEDQEAIACLDVLLEQVGELKVKEDGFSEGFISAATTLAGQNLKKDPEDEMWKSITEVFLNTLNFEAALNNELLLREILGLPQTVFQLPSQHIIVQGDEIEAVLIERLKKAKETLEDILQIETLGNYLKILDVLEKIDEDKSLSEVLRPFCFEMEQDLRDALIRSRVYPSIVKAYLADKERIANRLFYHMDLSFVNPVLSNRRASWDHYRDKVMNELRANYGVCVPHLKGDSFLAKMTWREQIADGLFKAEHRVLARAEKLGMALDEYCQWIKDPQSSIALPELELLSTITGRPVVIVCLEEDKWIEGVNLGFDSEPIILNVDEKGIWFPVELIRAKNKVSDPINQRES